MKLIRIPYKDASVKNEPVKTSSTPDSPEKFRVGAQVDSIRDWFLKFTNENIPKTESLTGITLQETGGRYIGMTKVRSVAGVKSTAAGLMQCTRTFIKDLLSNSYSRNIIRDLLAYVLDKKKSEVETLLTVDWLHTAQQNPQLSAVGLILGYAGFELNMQRFGMYPIIGIMAHISPKAASRLSGMIDEISRCEDFKEVGRVMNRYDLHYPDRIFKYHITPVDYTLQVMRKITGLGYTERQVIELVTTSVPGYSPPDFTSDDRLTAPEHNVYDYRPSLDPDKYDLLKSLEKKLEDRRIKGGFSHGILTLPDKLDDTADRKDDYSESVARTTKELNDAFSRTSLLLYLKKRSVFRAGKTKAESDRENLDRYKEFFMEVP